MRKVLKRTLLIGIFPLSLLQSQGQPNLITTTHVVFQQGLNNYSSTFQKRVGANGALEFGQ